MCCIAMLGCANPEPNLSVDINQIFRMTDGLKMLPEFPYEALAMNSLQQLKVALPASCE